MDCTRAKTLLEEYFEGTLSARQTQAVAVHLSACPACAAELQQIQRVVAALAAVPEVLPDAHMPARIAARVASVPAPEARRRAAGWGWLGVAAAGSLAGLSAVAYALPLVISEGLAADAPVLSTCLATALVFQSWFDAAARVLSVFWHGLVDVTHALGFALAAAAPTLAG